MTTLDNKQPGIPSEANANASTARPLHLPADISYTCQNSGVCCTVFDTIPVSHDCAELLHSLTPDQEASIRADAGADRQSFTAPGMPGDPARLTRKQDGSCVFFDKDHLCAVHRIAGAQAKPQVCRDFPYRYVETENGAYVGLSFVCPAVRGNLGTPVREQLALLNEHKKVASSVLDALPVVALNRRIVLSWAEYLALENTFTELLSISSIPLNQRLIACCALVNFVDAYAEELAGAPVTGSDNRLTPGGLSDFLSALHATGYSQLLRVAARHRNNSPAVRRMFLGMFAGFANTLHRKGGRVRTVISVMIQYVQHMGKLGKVRLKPINVVLSHRELQRSKLPQTRDASELLERYVRHCVFRKDLVLGTNVSRRLRLLVLNVALVPWYAAAEAKANGRTAAADNDYSEAIAHIERLYGFHSRFFRFFEENATFDDIVEAFMLKPNYPFVMLGG